MNFFVLISKFTVRTVFNRIILSHRILRYSVIHYFLWLSVILFLLLIFIDWKLSLLKREFFEGILTEIHGFLFDVLFFGFLLSAYNGMQDKRLKRRQYLEELEDFRTWQSTEASYRNRGIIRRLLQLNVFPLDLRDCYLVRADLSKFDLFNANLEGANLSHSNLTEANLAMANLTRCNLTNVYLRDANLVGANLNGAIVSKYDWEKNSKGYGGHAWYYIYENYKLVVAPIYFSDPRVKRYILEKID